ncbi:MAG: 50S ribosomal protein L11 methyltransferase [Alphaproteobacteria bacterium]|nr:50S ribosomal protein L11 methyltransferase [Alphaproteobacteria bacterium]
MRIEYHRTLIADHVRNRVLYEALKRIIVPGETVVADVGAGTGLLGLMAARLGAKEVFLYEAAEVAGVAEGVIAASGFENCFVMPCHSSELEDAPPVDVIISETLGNYAFEEDIIATLNDARARFLKPDGVVLPRGVAQYAAPVVAPRLDRELRVWAETGAEFGLDLSLPERMSLNNAYVRRVSVDELLADSAQEWDRVDLSKPASAERSGCISWDAHEMATVFGFAVWWVADFGDGLSLSTGPEAPATHWEQLYFPLEQPLPFADGEQLCFEIRSQSAPECGTHLIWAGELKAVDGEVKSRQEMDLDKGYLP